MTTTRTDASPRPWRFDGRRLRDAQGHVIATLALGNRRTYGEAERLANGALMIAAGDLLDAAREVVRHRESVVGLGLTALWRAIAALAEAVRQAEAEAEGT